MEFIINVFIFLGVMILIITLGYINTLIQKNNKK